MGDLWLSPHEHGDDVEAHPDVARTAFTHPGGGKPAEPRLLLEADRLGRPAQ